MMQLSAAMIFLIATFCTACGHIPNSSQSVFSHPEIYSGSSAIVCGHIIDDANIVESDNRDEDLKSGGISIKNRGPLRNNFRGYACMQGKISYIGCKSGDMICTDQAYDYALTVEKVLSSRVK
jgi:hypothetical protein